MKFLVDESAGKSLVNYLKEKVHDIISVYNKRPGIKDSKICEWASKENRIILTNDKDFGRLVFYEKIKNKGIILLRLEDESSENKIRVISELLDKYSGKLKNNFTVVSEEKIRIRPLPFPLHKLN